MPGPHTAGSPVRRLRNHVQVSNMRGGNMDGTSGRLGYVQRPFFHSSTLHAPWKRRTSCVRLR